MRNATRKNRPHKRKSERVPEVKRPDYDALDTACDITATPAYRTARDQVLTALRRLKPGQSKPYAHFSRTVTDAAGKRVFEDVLRELVGESVIRWDEYRPSPSVVEKI